MHERLPPEIRTQYDRLTDQLVEEFSESVDAEAVCSRASNQLQHFNEAKILNFVPILVYRYTREELMHSGAGARRR